VPSFSIQKNKIAALSSCIEVFEMDLGYSRRLSELTGPARASPNRVELLLGLVPVGLVHQHATHDSV
jgi:hypothetical protein